MTTTHRLLTTVFVWVAFAWSITLVFGMAFWLSTELLLATAAFLVAAAVGATALVTRTPL
jgi:hypothetical protein